MDDSTASLRQQAITAALSSNWEEALNLNQQIIDFDPKNVDALNRIARAYFETGDLKSSKIHFENALSIDPYNQIAAKFLKRIETFSKRSSKSNGFKKGSRVCNQFLVTSDLFIEEPGKTKQVTLLKVAEPQKLSILSAGAAVNLIIKNRGIAVMDQDGEYLGVIPDDVSHRLVRLMRGGNKYQALIKTIKTNGLSILIRELFRSARFKNQPSFPDGLNATFAYSSNHIIVPDDNEDEPLFEGDEEVV